KSSPTYGFITTTPKPGWAGYDLLGTISRALNVPAGFDTDVNGSLLGEVTYGDAKGLTDAVYFTIGTGVGAGIMSGGNLVHGIAHPEAGHIPMVPRADDDYKGHCPFHGTCLEGMAAGPAIEERWGAKGKELAGRDEVWDLEAYYIAQAVVNCILMLAPQRIILGGGVMHQEQLFPLVRKKTVEMLKDYVKVPAVMDMEHYVVPASLKDDQGIMGCLKLALDSLS
ncbi:MAG: ROK family protein, partial [Lachnospiraceae bacterium]|nr:ROK family protein [Lachnospiraceae bacterium]